jgi:hypothetical protein
MADLKERFAAADRIESPDLWAEAHTRWREGDPRPAGGFVPRVEWKRFGTVAVAFAVFGAAVVFAWNVVTPERAPRPQPRPAVDLASELPVGWSELPPPPEVRSGAATAWTGSELLIWGGYEYVGSNEDPDAGGFAFDAASRRWERLPAPPLDGRSDPAYAWTGRELVIWGGWDGGFRDPPYFDDGAAYDPVARTWRILPAAPLAARAPFAVWTGAELIVWGSTDRFDRMRDGAAYDPASDTWRRIADAPTDVTDGSAVWSGEEMIVFGAALDGNNRADTLTAIGIAYDPVSDTWRELPPSGLSPQAMTASWLGDELIAWDYEHASAAYDPGTDGWRPLPAVPLKFSECRPVSVATTRAVFGEFCGETIVFSRGESRWHRDPMPPDDPPGGCCEVIEPFPAGDVVSVVSHWYGTALEAMDRRMHAYNPPAVVGTEARGDVIEPEPFLPATERVGDELRMPVVFPDGTRATLVVPVGLGLETLGVQPDVSYGFDGSFQGSIVFLHDRNASIARFVEPDQGTTLINSSAGGLELWRTRDDAFVNPFDVPPERRYVVRLNLRSWTVLIPIEMPAGADAEDRAARASLVASSLGIRETAEGFPVVAPTGEDALPDGVDHLEAPKLTFGDSLPEPNAIALRDVTISLRIVTGCNLEPEISDGFGSACLSRSIQANIGGRDEFVRHVVEGLRVEDLRPM